MDEGRTVKFLLLILFLLFVVFQYFEIPYFGLLLLLTAFLIVKFHKKEKNAYNKKLARYNFDFCLRQYNQDSKLKKAFKYSLDALPILIPFFIIIPYETREFSPYDFLYVAGLWALMFYIGSFYELYDYYYFSKDFIKKPGKDFDKIFWSDIERVEEMENEKIIILHLKTGESIKIGTDFYYTLGKEKVKIIEYIRQQI